MSGAQFSRRIHPARARLDETNPRGRWFYELVDDLRAAGRDWPEQVFCPLQAIANALPEALNRIGGPAAVHEFQQLGPLGIANIIDPLLTMAAWRMTQGIYRVDPALYQHIVETPLNGDIPADALSRLPEWCVFVETPGLTTVRTDGLGRADVLGAWARQDLDPETGKPMLAVTLLIPGDEAMTGQHLPLGGSLEAVVNDMHRNWQESGHNLPPEAADAVIGYLRPVLNLLLYIASSNDFSRRGRAGQPVNPEPVRTRRHGWRVFPAPGPVEWDVGVRMGAALRAAFAAAETGGGGAAHASPRGHVRRAHWHTFVSGPTKHADGSEIAAVGRKRELRWLPPIPVNLPEVGDLPATIRPVR